MEVQSLQGDRCETAPLRAQEDRKDADIQPCMHAAHCNTAFTAVQQHCVTVRATLGAKTGSEPSLRATRC